MDFYGHLKQAEERNRARQRELYWVIIALGLAAVAIVSGLVWLL
jgi:hypothetical protein